jgi:hypothetical protein
MGEPLAKPSLTLLNLAIEELSFLQSIGREDVLFCDNPSPNRDWRLVHIGGDDHIAWGPQTYLDLITSNHLKCGSHIDPGKHGSSKIAVKYTERVLFVQNFQYKQPIHKADYSLSMIVDSVKVRLLERGQSTLIKKDNKNVAVGKAGQIGGCLKWLPRDPKYWPDSHKTMIRDLFVIRMGPLLPSRTLYPKCAWVPYLPKILGGYEMAIDNDEVYQAYLSCPEPIRWVLNKAHLGLDIKYELELLSKINTNVSNRGVSGTTDYEKMMLNHLEQSSKVLNALTWKELQQKYPSDNDNPRYTLAKARDEGWSTFRDYVEQQFRGPMFLKLMTRTNKLVMFNSNPIPKTMKIIWDRMTEGGTHIYGSEPLSKDIFFNTLKNLSNNLFFNTIVNKMVVGYQVDYDSGFVDIIELPYRDIFIKEFPNLIIGKKFLGIREKQISGDRQFL